MAKKNTEVKKTVAKVRGVIKLPDNLPKTMGSFEELAYRLWKDGAIKVSKNGNYTKGTR